MLKSLWVMRHGLAESQFESDFTRPLSSVGAIQAKSVAKQIKQDGLIQPINMLVSPFARTQSTAKIVHSELDIALESETDEMLVHFADHKVLAEFLLSCDYEYLILISHMPIVAYLCQYLCSSMEMNGFETGQAVRLDFQLSATEEIKVTHSKTYFPK